MGSSRPEFTRRTVSPYRGLIPFTEQDESFFFGRSTEAEIVTNNLHSSRITVLFGESGVGKSSLLSAAVLPTLIRRARNNLTDFGDAEYCPVLFRDWRGGSDSVLRESVFSACQRLGLQVEPRANLESQVDAAGKASGRVLLIFDQVEEYFHYHSNKTWLAKLIQNRQLPIRLLLSIRQDSLALLDSLKLADASIFQNTLELQHLSPESALDAILRPVERYNRYQAPSDWVSIEPGASEKLVHELTEDRGEGKKLVQAAYLQLVLIRWWQADSHRRTLQFATLADKLGGTRQIVRRYVDETMGKLPLDQQSIGERAFTKLVTDSGRKIAHTVSDLGTDAATLMTDLQGARLIASVPPPPNTSPGEKCFEFSHDLVARAALEWRKEFRLRADAAEQQRALQAATTLNRRFRLYNRLLIGTVALAVAAAIAAGVLYLRASISDKDAQTALRKAQEATTTAKNAAQTAEINRLLALLSSENAFKSALWELYREPKAIRAAVLGRSLADVEVDIHDFEKLAYAAIGIDSNALDELPSELAASCSETSTRNSPTQLAACAATMSTFAGDSPSSLAFIVNHSYDDEVLGWLGTTQLEPDPVSVRRILKRKIEELSIANLNKFSWSYGGIGKVPWKGNESLIRELLGRIAALLDPAVPPRNGYSDTRSLLIDKMGELQPQLDGSEARKAVSGFVLSVSPSGLDNFPRTWLMPVEKLWRSTILQYESRRASPDFVYECRLLMNWDLDAARLQEAAKDIIDAGIEGKVQDDPGQRLASALHILIDLRGRNQAIHWLNSFPESDTSDKSWKRLVGAVAETQLQPNDYPATFEHFRPTFERSSADIYKEIFSAFARHYPKQALSFAMSELRSAKNWAQFEAITESLAKSSLRTSPEVAHSVIREIRDLQPILPTCEAFLPFVFKETIPEIIEVVKWPTCSGESRRSIITAIAIADGQNFGKVRYGTPVVDWRKFVAWAERRGYQKPADQPKFRAFPPRRREE